ncbi:MAG: M23 family metallopeptidase [Candidatus Kerfeldbacteria bacterium]|nr:M23 family metallopeptidase [Candidatus Kerfeldbacteria bacterium]
MKKIQLAIVLCACVCIMSGCTQTQTPPTTNTTNRSATQDQQPVLYNLGGVDVSTDVEFNAHNLDVDSGRTVAVFLFGQPLPKSPGQPQRINPNLEFGGLKTPVTLIAAMDGVVAFIKEQSESNDYEVFLQTHENSEWMVGYDHVTDLRVVKGQRVSVGDVLGKAARENTGYYRYELQINYEGGNDSVMYCPTDLLDPSVRAAEQAKLDALVKSWEQSYSAAFSGPAYPEQSGGCTQPTITNAESQGL